MPLGFLRGLDWGSGEGNVIAPQPFKRAYLRFALSELVSLGGTRLAYAAVNLGPSTLEIADNSEGESAPGGVAVKVVLRRHRMVLGGSFEETLSRFGPRMRRNLRYYRRQVAAKLHAEFCPSLTIVDSEAAVRQLKECGFSMQTSVDQVGPVQQFLRSEPGLFHMGLRAGDTWLGHLVGLRGGGFTYLFQQMNSIAFPSYSLCTAMRSYFIEHEISIGQTEIKFVNGTCDYFKQCCELDRCCVVVAHRGPAASLLLKWVAPRHNPPEHPLNLCRSANPGNLRA